MSRNLLTGLLTALASVILVVGAISLALAEGFNLVTPATPVPVLTEPPVVILPTGMNTLPPTITPPVQSPQPALVTPTPFVATSCPVPRGWTTYTVESGDTLQSLADRFNISKQNLMQANCMAVAQSLMAGTLVYLPPAPPTATRASTSTPRPYPTATIRPCGPPFGWIQYIVRPGDTLYKISLLYSTTVAQLQQANCLFGTIIRSGDTLWVPNVPTRVPSYTPTSVPPTSTRTATAKPSKTPTTVMTATDTAVLTATATDTDTPVPEATATPTDTDTPTKVPDGTPG